MKNDEEKGRTGQDLCREVEDVQFEEHPSTILQDAMEDYERSQADILIDEAALERGRAWSLLANKLVGHEG